MMIRAVICDDEEVQCRLLAEYLEDWGRERNVQVSAVSFPSAEKFLFAWEDDRAFDLLILDIEMGFMSGMELAERGVRYLVCGGGSAQMLFAYGGCGT